LLRVLMQWRLVQCRKKSFNTLAARVDMVTSF
jgi:hypothetical protein